MSCELSDCFYVTKRAERAGAAERDHIRPAARHPEIGLGARHRRFHLRDRRIGHEPYLRAEHDVEQQVAVEPVEPWAAEEENRVPADDLRGSGGEPRVVRLWPAAREHHIGTLGHRLSHQELELADLVSAETEAGEVVPLDEQARETDLVRKSRRIRKWGGECAEGKAC